MKTKLLALSLIITSLGALPLAAAAAPACKTGYVLQSGTCRKKPSSKSASQAACVIKGNVSAKKEKIYHVPGCPNYGQTKIDAPGERMFCTEKEATDAGWRKALNCPH